MLNGSVSDYFLNQREGVLAERFILFYKFGGIVGGFVSGWLFKKINPQSRLWVINLVLTSLIFLLPFFIVMIAIWIIESMSLIIMDESNKALPFKEILT